MNFDPGVLCFRSEILRTIFSPKGYKEETTGGIELQKSSKKCKVFTILVSLVSHYLLPYFVLCDWALVVVFEVSLMIVCGTSLNLFFVWLPTIVSRQDPLWKWRENGKQDWKGEFRETSSKVVYILEESVHGTIQNY